MREQQSMPDRWQRTTRQRGAWRVTDSLIVAYTFCATTKVLQRQRRRRCPRLSWLARKLPASTTVARWLLLVVSVRSPRAARTPWAARSRGERTTGLAHNLRLCSLRAIAVPAAGAASTCATATVARRATAAPRAQEGRQASQVRRAGQVTTAG